MKAIIAVNNLGWIGIGDKLLWYSSDDLKHFKKMTDGSTCLVGFRTFQALPPLPNRIISVDERNGLNLEPQWCIGGKRTYEKYAPYFTELHISRIDNNMVGDVSYPDLTNLNPECKIFEYFFK